MKKDKKKCYRCGLGGHFACAQNCLARSKTCAKCHNYEGTFCFRYKTSKPKQEQKSKTKKKVERGKVNCLESDTACEEDEYAFTIEFKKSGSGNGSETIDLQVGVVVIKIVLIDTGSSCNIVDQKTWEELKSKGIKCKSEKSIQKIYPYG